MSSLEGRKEREFANCLVEDGDRIVHASGRKRVKRLVWDRWKTMPRRHNRTVGARSNPKGLGAAEGEPMEDNETQGPAKAVV
jgi:hypothetical protein